jgi:hypothetical protein
MNRDSYARQLRHAAAAADWQRAERLGRSYGWNLLGEAIGRAVAWLLGWMEARRRLPPTRQ